MSETTKKYSFFHIKNVNSFPVIKVQRKKRLTVCSAIALCTF